MVMNIGTHKNKLLKSKKKRSFTIIHNTKMSDYDSDEEIVLKKEKSKKFLFRMV